MQVVLAFFLVVLAHLIGTSGISLEKPVNLAVLSNDLQTLEATYPSPELWPESKIIKYDDQLTFVVSKAPLAAEGACQFLMLDGKLTLAKSKRRLGGHEMHSHIEIRRLLFRNAAFYFEDTSSEPVLNFRDYYIVDYSPPDGQINKEPAIEYVPQKQFESELTASLPTIRHESQLTGAKKIKTYFRLKSGAKVQIRYDQQNDEVVFIAYFQIIIMTDGKDLIEKCDRLSSLSFRPNRPSPILSVLSVIHGVRVIQTASRPTHGSTAESLKIRRHHLLKDMSEGSTTTLDVVGMVEYDRGRALRLDTITTNGRRVVRIFGPFVADERSSLYSLCLATSANASPVLFSCLPGNTDIAEILLQEDGDYLQMATNASRTMDLIMRYASLEPYIGYISYKQFAHTLEVVSDAMTCADGSLHNSYRLFVDVFLIYDCDSGIAWFGVLDIWVDSNRQTSSLWENVAGVSYDSNAKGFVRGNGFLTDFKVRQRYPTFPRNIPMALQMTTDSGKISIAVDVRSIEWDLYSIREYLMESKSLRYGVVRVNKRILFLVTKSVDTIHGEIKKTVVVSGKGSYDTCTWSECVEVVEVIHDGATLAVRQSPASEQRGILPRVFWPKTYQSMNLVNILPKSYEERYVKLSTFKRNMQELALLLHQRCQPNVKFTINVYYFESKEQVIIGNYDCALSYILFFSDFKVITYPNVRKVATSASHKEWEAHRLPFFRSSANIAPYFEDVQEGTNRSVPFPESKGDQLRTKYSDYVIHGLLYDQIGNTLHSRSMFLTEVYALRGLPNIRETPTRDEPEQLKLPGGPRVNVYRQ